MRVLHVAATRNAENSAAWRILNAQRLIGVDAFALVHENRNKMPFTFIFNKGIQRYRFIISQKVNSVITRIAHKRKPILPWSYNFAVGGNIQKFDEVDFDIINLHWIPSVINLEHLKNINRPIVLTLHDVWPITGGCHCNLSCVNWRTKCEQCPQVLENVPDLLSASTNLFKKKQAFQNISDLTIVAPSNWIADMARNSPLFTNRRIIVIPNCIDSRIYRPGNSHKYKTKIGIDPDKFHILFVVAGPLNQYHKGFDYLLALISKIMSGRYSHLIEFLVVGDKSNLDYNPSAQVKFIGEVNSQEKMREVYCAADLVISTSRQDNLPNVLLEAIFCGIPIVAFDIGGIRDIVIPGVNGALVPLGNLEKMLKEIYEIIDNPLNREIIVERANNLYSFNRVGLKYLKIYSEIQRNII